MRAALHSLVNAREEAGTPQLFAAVRRFTSRKQYDESRQILILCAKPVEYPGTDGRVSKSRVAGVYQQLRGRVIELVGMHRLDEAQIVNVLFQVRQAVGNPVAALSDLVERGLRPQKLGNAADECETLARQKRRGTILAIEPFQVRLVLEKFQLAGRSGHVQINNSPHF